MKVLFAIKTLATAIGGAERLAACLSTSISSSNKDWDVHILTFDNTTDSLFYPLGDRVQHHGLGISDTAPKSKIWHYPSIILNLRRIVLRENPDIVIAFMHSMFVPMSLAMIGTGTKIVLSEHTVPKYYKKRPLEFVLLYLCSFLSCGMTVPSKHVAKLYPKSMWKKMAFLPNPIISNFKKSNVTDKKTILSVGRLIKDKGYKSLIKAFAILAPRYPEWTLVIYGDGEEKENLEKLIEHYNLQGRISLAGISNDMDSVYQTGEIFVLPSKYESFGLSTVEAMSHGLPVIGFKDCTGTSDVIEDGVNGSLVKKRCYIELSKDIENLINNPKLRRIYGDKGYEKSKNFSLEASTKAWIKYLSKLVRAS